jgi:peptide/nickel transport system substrate-binding protein
VVRPINVGNGPRAVAVGAGSVWVANNFDGTVSRIDPRTNAVTATIPTGRGPSGVAVDGETVWVANDLDASLTRINPATDRVVLKIRLDNPPKGLAIAGGSVLVAVQAQGLAHRGGTLTIYSGRRGLKTIDPSISYESYTFAIPSLTNDGLVAVKHVGGSDGSTLVPDLATSLPLPTNRGTTYTFQLRAGIRYSSGRVVRAEDFRRAIERVFALNSPGLGFYTGIVGGARCKEAPKTCDLSKGIVVDNGARLVTFRLVAPDADFLYKLMLPFAGAVPPGIPDRDVGTQPLPATGPYKVARYVPNRELVFVRNPFFREWSQAARPGGYPDRIVWRLDVKADSATRAVEEGRADVAYDFVPPELLTEVKTRYASQLHVDPVPGTYFYLLDARLRPFNDVRVRRALNYAVDRDAVIHIARGAEVAQPTCQVLPPNFPGYRPYCPYTANPSASGRWVGPDLARARRLVSASGTKGERVTVWTSEKAEGEYVATVLRRLGYRSRLKTVTPYSPNYLDAIFLDPRNKSRSPLFVGSPTTRRHPASSTPGSSTARTFVTGGLIGKSRVQPSCRPPMREQRMRSGRASTATSPTRRHGSSSTTTSRPTSSRAGSVTSSTTCTTASCSTNCG